MSSIECQKRSKKRRKYQVVHIMGGKCCICGYDKCVSALDLHHVSEKRNGKESMSGIIYHQSWVKILKELKKCILVCANCHREIHDTENGIKDITFKRYYREWIKKECKRCGKEFETNGDGIYCSQLCSHLDQRKVDRPSKEELQKLLNDGVKWVELGRTFGVSDNSVRKWARRYELIS